ncbi:hypothetical protein [Maioricimonas sp. JC845]|uniref:hypothetical protein n=1 Tax=Maioricimonas sp. JC845 TaxID=3232138 RepID=UPI00345A11C9
MRGLPMLCVLAGLLLCHSGCINVFAIAGKMLLGDPMVPSTFEQRTGVDLSEGLDRVIVVCSAPHGVTDEFDALPLDLQERLYREMGRRGIDVVKPDEVASVLDETGGRIDPQRLAREFDDVAYIFHVDVEQFTLLESGSPNLYRGRSAGNVYGYEARSVDPHADVERRHVVKVFEQEFGSEYPRAHPVTADSTPIRVFQRRFLDHLSEVVGRNFYDVRTTEAF